VLKSYELHRHLPVTRMARRGISCGHRTVEKPRVCPSAPAPIRRVSDQILDSRMKADGRFVSMIWSQAEGLLRYLPVLFQKPFASGESGPEQSGLLSVAEGFGSKSAATHTHNDGLASFVAGDGTMSAPGVSFQGQLRRRRGMYMGSQVVSLWHV